MSAVPTAASRPPAPAGSEPTWDAPGGLAIRETRSWATWQLLVGFAAALVLGMIIGYSGKKSSTQAASSTPGHTTINLGGPSVTTAAKGATGSARLLPGTTTTVRSATSTTPPSTTPVNAPQVVLMERTAGAGPDQLPSFTTGGTWNTGWAFSCVGAPGGSAAFTVLAVPEGAGAGAPITVVSQTSRAGSGVSPETASGRFHLQITTDPGCQWAAKVTGVG